MTGRAVDQQTWAESTFEVPPQRVRRTFSPPDPAEAHVAERIRKTRGDSLSIRLLPLLAFGIDLVLIATSVGVAGWARADLSMFADSDAVQMSLQVAEPTVILVWVATLVGLGAYHRDVFGEGAEELRRVVSASILAAGVVGVACFLAKFDLSRGFFTLSFVIGTSLLFTGRVVLRRGLRRARKRGRLQHHVVLAGPAEAVDEIAEILRREPWLGYSVVGALTTEPHGEATDAGVPVIGRLSDLSRIRESGADLVCFVGGAFHSARELRESVWDLEAHDVQVVVSPSLTDVSGGRVRIRPVAGLPLVHVDRSRSARAARWEKRMLDVVGSAVVIAMISPILLFAALRIKMVDGGSIFYRQTRIGRDGHEFACLKFRTMIEDADAHLEQMQKEHGAEALLFKLKDDWRITKPGRWMRRYSVDELPQLFNVLFGQMSLVGPRPQVPREVALYSPTMHRRLQVRPGMTGLWQVSGRSNLSLTEAMRLDVFYVDNWSMMQDFAILSRTVNAVFRGEGAY